jgi:O-antigen/teichoic acid export membrane protein
MRLGWNLAAGLANSFWGAFVGLAAVPFFLRYLGIEAYGLIGFYSALQALFGLLDAGLAPTINREIARSGSAEERSQARNLLHTLGFFYWAAAGVIALVTIATAPLIGRHWLTSAKLPSSTLTQAVMLMGLIVAGRFPVGLYVGALMGAQRMAAASFIEMAIVTLANVGAIGILAFVSPTIHAFFIWQAVIALINLVVIRAAAWQALRDPDDPRTPRFDRAGLKRIWRFSANMGITALLGTIILQSDKIILGKFVSLSELGRYTLAGMGMRSLQIFVAPVFSAVYPKMTALHAAGRVVEIRALYKSGTRLLMAALFPLAAFVAVFSTDIFTLWTGDPQLAGGINVVVALLLLGMALNAAMHFPYALQLAYGEANLPVRINLILMALFAPLVVVLTFRYGIVGAAAAWAIFNILYLLLGTWMTHRILLIGEGLSWVVADVGLPFVLAIGVAGVGGYTIRALDSEVYSRLLLGGALAGAAFVLIVAISPELRRGAQRFLAQALSRDLPWLHGQSRPSDRS